MPESLPIDDAADGGHAADHAAIDRLASELLPALIAKLGATGLGELEVRQDGWRVRLRRPADGVARGDRRPAGGAARSQPGHAGHGHGPLPTEGHRGARAAASTNGAGPGQQVPVGPGPGMPAAVPTDGPAVAVSPAVGVFRPNPDTTAGRRVRAGDRARRGRRARRPAGGRRAGRRHRRRAARQWRRGRRVRPGPRRHRVRRSPGDGRLRRVPQDPHREPRRDRPAGPACLPHARDRGGRRLQRGRPRIAAGPACRRGDLHRPGRRASLVPVGAGGHLGGARHRLRRDPPGLRLPVRGRGLRRRGGRARPDVHRPARRRARAVREQGGDPPPARLARAADDPRLRRDAARRPARPRRGGADRLPGAHQAVGRWRGQGHAHGAHRARARVGAARLPLRGEGRVRRRLAVPREVARRDPPRRGPGGGRPLRPRRPPRRARLLGPAPPPEDHRGGPDARPSRRPRARTSPSARSARSSPPGTRTSARSSSSSTATTTRISSRSTAASRSSTP